MSIRLRHLAEINPPVLGWEQIPDDCLLTFVPLEAVWPRQVDFTRMRPKSETSTGYTRFMEGDVIVPKITPTFEADRSTWITGSPTTVLTGTTELHVVRPGSQLDPRYLDYLLSSRPFLEGGASEMIGVAGQKRVPDGWIRDFLVPVDDPRQQREIADYLDTETAHIDTLISKKRRLIQLLEEYDQSKIDDCFGKIPEDGGVRLGYLAEVRTGVTLGGRDSLHAGGITVPYLRVANVKEDRLDLNEVKTVVVDLATAKRTALCSGDVLMTEGGDIDKLGRGTVWRGEIDPCLHQNHVFAVRVRKQDLLPEFLALVTRTSYARHYFEMTGVRSTNLASTSASKVADFRVPLPSVEDQHRLVQEYQHEWEALENARTAIGRQLSLLSERRQALITAAVTGEIPVTGMEV